MNTQIPPPYGAVLPSINRRKPITESGQWSSVRVALIDGSDPKKIKVLMLLQKRNSNTFWWRLPGGKIEQGESPDEALVREFSEEVRTAFPKGCHILDSRFTMRGTSEAPLMVCAIAEHSLAHITEWKATSRDSEVLLARWFPLEELPFDPRGPLAEGCAIDRYNIDMMEEVLFRHFRYLVRKVRCAPFLARSLQVIDHHRKVKKP